MESMECMAMTLSRTLNNCELSNIEQSLYNIKKLLFKLLIRGNPPEFANKSHLSPTKHEQHSATI